MKLISENANEGSPRRDNDGGGNLRYIVSTYVNIAMDAPIQLLYANNKKKLKIKGR
jgi:hypothetical protein